MANLTKGRNIKESDLYIGAAIILIHPQLGQNIGMVARSMLNCGLTDLRLVAPRDGWPSGEAIAASAGAQRVIDNAKLFDTTQDAIADLSFVLATTARHRDMIKHVYTPDNASDEIIKRTPQNSTTPTCGILFGPERSGLVNDDIALADGVLNFPLNPGFSSLNLAQAVLLVCHNWYSKVVSEKYVDNFHTGNTDIATKEEINHMLKRLEQVLDETNFFKSDILRPLTIRNITNMFCRTDITSQEINTMQGIITAFKSGKRNE